MLACEDYPSLKSRQATKIQTEFPPWLGRLSDNQIHGLSFILDKQYGGGIIALRNLDDPSKYASSEFAAVAIDELTKNTEEVFSQFRSIMRWPGINHTRFLAGTNPGGVGHCVPFGDVLTRDGWKPIQDIEIGEEVATLDNYDRLIFAPTDQIHKQKYTGKMAFFSSATADIICTPEHKIARRTETKNSGGRKFHSVSLVKAKDISDVTRFVRAANEWNGNEIEVFNIPILESRRLKLKQPLAVCGDDFCEFMGWFLSEGHTVDRDKAFGISQSKKQNRDKIEKLLKRMGFSYGKTKNGFLIHSPNWWFYLKQFGKCREKFIPKEIKNTSKRQLQLFLNAAMLGDGHNKTYYTTSVTLADDMQEIGLRLGFSPSLRARQRKNRDGLSYAINFRDGRLGWMEKNQVAWRDFDGDVFCLGIPELHRFFIRQNGTIWLSGNSWVKRIWVDKDFPDSEPEPEQFYFVKAFAKDNPFLSPEYVKSLQGLPEALRKAYLEGSWDVYEGQFFDEWREELHTLPSFTVPDGWRKFRCIDHGRRAPTACIWGAVDYDGRIYIYREYYERGLDADINAKNIKKLSKKDGKYWFTVLDSACFARIGAGETIGEIYERNGVPAYPSPKDRKAGWALFHEYLRPPPIDVSTDLPHLVFFKNCPHAIRTIPTLQYREEKDGSRNFEDLDSNGEDHIADAISYALQFMHEGKSVKANEDPIAKLLRKNKKKNSFSPRNLNKFYSGKNRKK